MSPVRETTSPAHTATASGASWLLGPLAFAAVATAQALGVAT
jgi:hypothetical protein